MARRPISAKVRYRVLERDKFACQCCGAMAPNVTLHVDHIVAVVNGGSDEMENLRAVCITCNVGKGALEPNILSIGGRPTYPIRISDTDVKVCGDELTKPIFWIGEQWAVTAYGVECRDGTYCIEAKRLWMDEKNWGWDKHMREKDWVNQYDFVQALDWAKQHFAHLKNKNRERA